MKMFTIKASLVAGLSHTIAQLSPQQKCCVDTDPVKANRMALNIVKDIEECNKVFMAATKETADKLTACFEGFKKELDVEGEGKSDEDKNKIAAVKTNLYRKEAEKIQAASTAKGDELVQVILSDEKAEAAKKLVRLTVGSWQDTAAFVETAEALDDAK